MDYTSTKIKPSSSVKINSKSKNGTKNSKFPISMNRKPQTFSSTINRPTPTRKVSSRSSSATKSSLNLKNNKQNQFTKIAPSISKTKLKSALTFISTTTLFQFTKTIQVQPSSSSLIRSTESSSLLDIKPAAAPVSDNNINLKNIQSSSSPLPNTQPKVNSMIWLVPVLGMLGVVGTACLYFCFARRKKAKKEAVKDKRKSWASTSTIQTSIMVPEKVEQDNRPKRWTTSTLIEPSPSLFFLKNQYAPQLALSPSLIGACQISRSNTLIDHLGVTKDQDSE